jgi:hypothetical protein
MREQAAQLELGELVPDGGRRDVQATTLDQVPRTDGLARGDVLLDHECKQLALPHGQRCRRVSRHLQEF